jgi:hypothetical protein
MVDFYRKFTKQSKDEKLFRTAAQQNLVTAEDAESAKNGCCVVCRTFLMARSYELEQWKSLNSSDKRFVNVKLNSSRSMTFLWAQRMHHAVRQM